CECARQHFNRDQCIDRFLARTSLARFAAKPAETEVRVVKRLDCVPICDLIRGRFFAIGLRVKINGPRQSRMQTAEHSNLADYDSSEVLGVAAFSSGKLAYRPEIAAVDKHVGGGMRQRHVDGNFTVTCT